MRKTLDTLKALGEENRFRIAIALREKRMCVCEIHEILNISNSTLSSHLKTLRYAGIIDQKKDGRWIDYFLNKNNKTAIEILDLLYKSMENKSIIEKDLEKVKKLTREVCSNQKNID